MHGSSSHRGKFRHLTLHFAVTLISFSLCISRNVQNWQRRHSLHMRCHNSLKKYRRKPFSHIYHHDGLPRKCLCGVQEESGFTAAHAGSSAGVIYSWLGGRALLESHQWFFCFLSPSCLKQVKAGLLHLLPSLCCSLRAPPGRLVFRHYNYLFCCWHTHTHTPLLLLGWGSTGHTLFRLCVSYMYAKPLQATHSSGSGEKRTHMLKAKQTTAAILSVDLTNNQSRAATLDYLVSVWCVNCD